jgi:hypothetical protein
VQISDARSIGHQKQNGWFKMSSLRNAIWIGAAWLSLAAGIFFVLGRINLSVLFEIARNPVLTDATVVSTDCPNHASVYYAYVVSDRSCAGRASLGNKCNSLNKSDKMRIYFSSRVPCLSQADDPHAALVNELIFIGLAAFFFPAAIIAIVYSRGM